MGLWLALFSMALLIVTPVCHTSRKEKHSSLMHIIFAFKKKVKIGLCTGKEVCICKGHLFKISYVPNITKGVILGFNFT